MTHNRIITILMAVAASAITCPALADQAFDSCVEQLCTSTDQMDCWVKAGSELCNDGVGCSDVPDHAGALIIDKMDGQWFVQTQYGKGWVENRSMMIDSSMCPGL